MVRKETHLHIFLTTPSLSIGVSTGHACQTHSVGFATVARLYPIAIVHPVARLYPVALLHYFNGGDGPQLTSRDFCPCGGSDQGLKTHLEVSM